MDQKKTSIPILRFNPNSVNSSYNLQMALTGMITHGHGESLWSLFFSGLCTWVYACLGGTLATKNVGGGGYYHHLSWKGTLPFID